MTVNSLPPPPARTMASNVFAATADAFLGAFPQLVSDINNTAAIMNAQSTQTANDVLNTAANAAAAVAAANATRWASGVYTDGTPVYSPANGLTYRKKGAAGGTVDPSLDLANWNLVTVGAGQGGAILTGSVTLVPTSSAAMIVTPSAPGQYATLPAATSCQKGMNLYCIYNAGDYDYGFKDNTGKQLGWVRPGTSAYIGLADNSTVAGSWVGIGLEKLGVTAQYLNTALSTSYQASAVAPVQRITLDSNRTCLLFGYGSCIAIVYDASTQTWGAPVLISASTTGFTATLSAANQILVATAYATAMVVMTLSITGTAITPNTSSKQSVTLAQSLNSFGSMIAVGASFVFGYYCASSTVGSRIVTLSGNAPTVGGEITYGSSNTAPMLFAISASTYVSFHSYGSSMSIVATPVSISGTLGTPGTTAVVPTYTNNFRVLALPSGRWAVITNNASSQLTGSIVSVTGSVASVSTVLLSAQTPTVLAMWDVSIVGANKVFVAYANGSTQLYANILTDTAGVASAGAEVLQVTGSSAIAGGSICCFYASGTNVSVSLFNGTSPAFAITYSAAGASAAIVSVVSTPSGNTVPTLTASDAYGNRSPLVLQAGNAAYAAKATAAQGPTTRFTPNSMTAVKSPIYTLPGIGGCNANGVAANESWFTFPVDSGAAGVVINRVEAAA